MIRIFWAFAKCPKGYKLINHQKKWIKDWKKDIKFNLLYQISRDGDRTSTFYNKVKDKAPTLILVKTKEGYTCGGYTSITWDKSGNYKKDELAFLF